MTESRTDRPSSEQIAGEIRRRKRRRQLRRVIRSALYGLLTVAALAILVSTLFFPALKIYGNSMTPTLEEGEIVIARKSSSFKPGDIIAFYYNNKILVKRVICGPGDWFNMSSPAPSDPRPSAVRKAPWGSTGSAWRSGFPPWSCIPS